MGILKAVAFDLDGTLYPNYRLYIRLYPYLMLHPVFFNAFMKVRHSLHSGHFEQIEGSAQYSSFYDKQAAGMARLLGKDTEETKQKVNRLIYGKWDKFFTAIKVFPHLRDTLTAFKGAGLRLAVLSDFPPVQKLSLLGLDEFFEVAVSSEETGNVKPSRVPFEYLIKALALPPDEILYVGNSVFYDVKGAKSSGIKSALIRKGPFSTGFVSRKNAEEADFVFRDYRQLREYVLK
jgi:putative hydrolase of the HAD superfamily